MNLETRVRDALLDAGIAPDAVTVRAADMTASVVGNPPLTCEMAQAVGGAFTNNRVTRPYPEGGGGTVTAISPDGSLTVHFRSDIPLEGP